MRVRSEGMVSVLVMFALSIWYFPFINQSVAVEPAFQQGSIAEPVNEVREIDMIAKRYTFEPNVLELCAGEPVVLVIDSVDVDHGFQIKELGIKVKLKKKSKTRVSLKIDEPGEYEIRCSVYCGKGHKRMKGKVIVRRCGGQAEEKGGRN